MPRADLARRRHPPTPLAGRLALQSLLFALGEGTFLTGSAVFFTQIVGLRSAEVGLGLTIGGVAGFLAAVPMGRLVDRYGPKRMWVLSALGQGALFLLWPTVGDLTGYILLVVGMDIVGALGGAAHSAYTIDVLPRDQLVTSRAFMYSALNLGFTLGSLVGGVALATDSVTVMKAVPLLTAATKVLNAVMVARLPNAPHDDKTPQQRREKPPGPGPLRNVGWLATCFFIGVMWTNQVLLNVVIPLWLVERTDAPKVVLAFLFATNTIMCIVLPMAAARGIRDVPTALRAVRISSVFFVLSCAITLLTHDTVGWLTIALVWLGHVTVTGAELYLSASGWSLEADLMDPERRGEYQGAAALSGTLGKVWAPAAYTFLAMTWGVLGWVVIAAIVTAAAVGLHPAVAAAQRFRTRYAAVPD